jgi:hypothetical protein
MGIITSAGPKYKIDFLELLLKIIILKSAHDATSKLVRPGTKARA